MSSVAQSAGRARGASKEARRVMEAPVVTTGAGAREAVADGGSASALSGAITVEHGLEDCPRRALNCCSDRGVAPHQRKSRRLPLHVAICHERRQLALKLLVLSSKGGLLVIVKQFRDR